MDAFPHAYEPVRQVSRLTGEDLLAALDADEPLLVTGALARLPLVEALARCVDDRARLQLLAQTFGDREVQAVDLPVAGRLPGDRKETRTLAFSALAGLLEQQLAGAGATRLYMQNQPVVRFPELGWVPPFGVADRAGWYHAHSGLWTGAGGQTVNFHYDNSINSICMLAGTKRVALLPYGALPDMYPIFDTATNVTGSSVRLLDPDEARFPRFRDALGALKVAVVGPGDALLVPPHWWHHVESFGLNVMVNNWSIPFSIDRWKAIGRNRARAMLHFEGASGVLRDAYASRYAASVFRSQSSDVPAAVDAEADALLAEAAALFEGVPEGWRRNGRLSYDYFVFQKYGAPLAHAPGAYAALLELVATRLQRGDSIAPLG
jgi:hypothetical protein